MPLSRFRLILCSSMLLSAPIVAGLLLSCGGEASDTITNGPVVHHDLQVRILPSEHRLTGTDRITIRQSGLRELLLSLSPEAQVRAVRVDGSPAEFRRRAGRIKVPLPGEQGRRDIVVEIHYDGRFQDPVPVMPANTDNPGYGVTGTITDSGVFLLGGAGWYPVVDAPTAAFRLTVTAPQGMVAVTAGKSLGHRTEGRRTVSTWEIPAMAEPIALSAGPYEIRERAVGEITAATYLFPQSRHLSDGYLAAVERFIRFYEGLFGPYPFQKFAVVENFFPTGYGFPSYTLMGTRVLHLPFIKHTSLGHEIAHCWWGNGVGVNASRGNWCEGLTSYVSDYLFQEQEGPAAAAEYRRQLLRNYAALVPESRDFPLNAFRSRIDPPTKAIGYDKGAMVFHMLRREVGDEVFWPALKTLYKDYRFQQISWREIQAVFEKTHGRSLDIFFTQWLDRAGAPHLALEGVRTFRRSGRRYVAGTLRQTAPHYRVQVPVSVTGPWGEQTILVEMEGESTGFEAALPAEATDAPPEMLRVDPDADLFRRLYPAEIPATINSLRGSRRTTLVLSESGPEARARARLLSAALGLSSAKVVEERRISRSDLQEADVIFLGMPRNPDLLRGMGTASVDRKAVRIGGDAFPRHGHAFFMVFQHPFTKGRVAALCMGPDATAESVLPKIPHYGKYSYLVFNGTRNRTKGVWQASDSPLIHRF